MGTNDLNSERPPELIGKSIADLAASQNNENHDVTISNSIVRNDNQELREKVQHLNKGKLHLNQKGVRVLSDIYLREISKILNWYETGILAGFKEYMSEKSSINIDEILDCKSILKSMRWDNKHKLIFAHLSINSIRNKFDLLEKQIGENMDVLMISEKSIDGNFPVENFLLPGSSIPHRSNRASKGGGIRLGGYFTKPFNYRKKPMERFYVELNLHKNKWLVNCSYSPIKVLLTIICWH